MFFIQRTITVVYTIGDIHTSRKPLQSWLTLLTFTDDQIPIHELILHKLCKKDVYGHDDEAAARFMNGQFIDGTSGYDSSLKWKRDCSQ